MSGVIALGDNTHNAGQTTTAKYNVEQTIVATITTILWTLLVFIPLIQVTEIMVLSL